ncbi:protein snakeskin-like [Microplitis mediator]|uniref:protein snakeskin-like n=1 Tax=Microplitis mediator TaxID=375433 RepID=UPI002557BA7F|nr:protein snakeskin-like [Microplitis mediator]
MSSFTRLSIIRLLELAIVCAIIGLHWHSENYGDLPTRFISTGTVGGYLIILVGLFAGGLMGTPVNRRVDLFFSLVGCVLFVASGALVIDAFNQIAYKSAERDRGLARGSLCVIEGALFLVDAFFTFRGEA